MSAPAIATHEAPRARSQIGRYSLWQLRDYLMDRGTPTFIVSTLFGYLSLSSMLPSLRRGLEQVSANQIARYGSVEAAREAMVREFNFAFLHSFLGAIVFLGALFAMRGIVADDRKLGYYRFLFSKPLTPARYYGQAFVVHGLGFAFVALVLGALYGIMVAPVLSVPLLSMLMLVYLCYAGIAFLLSAAARWDWLSLVSVTVAATYLWGRFGQSDSVLAKLLYLLPPLHKTGEVYEAAARGVASPWQTIAWIAGYGVLSFIAGLVVLRHRRLAII